MAIFGNMSITNAGQVLYTKAQSGEPIVFTRMQLGSGQIGTQNPATLISLVTPQFYVPISSITANAEAKTATVSGIINNSAIVTATYICEIALFAQDPDLGEILYSYASAGTQGDYMAPASQGAYSWNYQINAAVGNAANVTANLSNLQYDYGVVISDTSFTFLTGGNQKEINKRIDTILKTVNATTLNSLYAVDAPQTTEKTDIIGMINEVNTRAKGLKEIYLPLWVADSTCASFSSSSYFGWVKKGATTCLANNNTITVDCTLLSVDVSKFPVGTTFALEVVAKTSSETYSSMASLFDITTSGSVSGSTITTFSTSFTKLRSSNFSLTGAHNYGVLIGGNGSNTGYLASAHLVAILP